MKQSFPLFRLLLLFLNIMVAFPVLASDNFDYTENGIYYKILSKSDKTVCVTNYGTNRYKGDIVIPEKLKNGYAVTEIGDRAFRGSSITSIVFPNSITSIGEDAFCFCYELNSISLSNSLISIGRGAFWGCRFPSITLPNSLKSIGEEAFISCDLSKIELPSSLTTIEKGVFKSCHNLTSIVLPNSLTTLGQEAFMYCDNLQSIELSNSLTSIQSTTFYGCSSLRSITIPNSVTSIGNEAFSSCSELESVKIGNSVKSIGHSAFYFCWNLTSVNLPNSLEYIAANAFSYCGNLSAITIPDSVTSMSDGVFWGCQSLNSVSISSSLTYLGYGSFYLCSELKSVEFGNSVMGVSDYSFYGSKIEEVTFPASMKGIGRMAFNDCENLKKIVCKAPTPPVLLANAFDEKAYEEATLYVPQESRWLYKKHSTWRLFKNIVSLADSGINDIEEDSDISLDQPYHIYNLDGLCLGEDIRTLVPGIYIIKQGKKTKKIFFQGF